MVMNVIKRNGLMEPFDERKLRGSIEKAMIDARLKIDELSDDIDQIVDSTMRSLNNKQDVDISELRSSILEELEKRKPVAAAAWRSFDAKYKTKAGGT